MPSANSDKMGFSSAYFDELERKIEVLSQLAETGYRHEALTLCLVYIDGLAQRLCWPSERNGANFVRALGEYTKDVEMSLVHPLQLSRALARLKPAWKPVSTAVGAAFPGPTYELLSASTVIAALGSTVSAQQRGDLEREIWRGTIAAVAYDRMRNSAVHALGASPRSFDSTRYAGKPAQPLDLPRLQRAARDLAAEARRRPEATGDWF